MTPYEQAFNWIRAEYMEMPGMRLTPQQVERLSCVKTSVCRLALEDLVRAGFLSNGTNGVYARSTDVDRVRRRLPGSESDQHVQVSVSSRTR